ncbi:HAUS augmin-like complex subunit 3 isoform X2 [Cygnus olor]|uniref:HAUS augmin-like complex subunit 3 isoform X2 n=1 Tax=Cygnus olor TaxID=8869 RepID=UPI001ADE4A58|nr:HAUS augmin-like complex subunit 3 isoform X2 [Cygnus olor]
MFSQRRSQTFLDTVNRGAEFVKTLQLVYPQAETLCESDFDWLFDCPETEQFLEWFCKTVGEENVLSPAEVQAYDALVAAGKPILEGDELEQALRKCHRVPQLPRVIPEAEGPSLKALEREVQELKDYRVRQLWRHNKLQVWAAGLQQELSYLQKEEKVVKRALRKAQEDLEVEVFQASAVLNQISEVAKQLVNWHGEGGKDQSPAMLYEMDLSSYIELEQQSADVFEQFFQQVLPGTAQAPDAQGADVQRESSLQERLEAWTEMDLAWEILEGRQVALCPECAETQQVAAEKSQEIIVQGSRAERLAEGSSGSEMPSMGDAEKRGGSQKAPERTDTSQTKVVKSLRTNVDELSGNQCSYWKELKQMEKAYICAQREVITMTAKVEGHSAALQWAQKTLKAIKENKRAVEAQLQSHTTMLQEQLRALRCDIAHTHAQQLLPLLKAAACLFLLPVLQAQLSLETARLQDIAQRQEEAAAWLASQHSRLDLLGLQLKQERKELDQKAAWLREMETLLKDAQTKLQEYHDYFKEADSSVKGCARTQAKPKDLTTMRLWDVLVGQDRDEQLFCSYEAIAAHSSQLVKDRRALEIQLAAPMPQLPALESATEKLYRLLYNNSNQLQLCSPDTLYQKLTDLLSDLKVKRRSLQNPILQVERNLYIYFFCNEDRLREVVEELEKEALASSKRLLMALPNTKE